MFSLSLITRFVPSTDVSQDSDLPILTSLANEFIMDSAISRVLGFQGSSTGADEYLLRYGDASGLNDTWTPLSNITPYVFPSLLDFHSVVPYDGPLPLPTLCTPLV